MRMTAKSILIIDAIKSPRTAVDDKTAYLLLTILRDTFNFLKLTTFYLSRKGYQNHAASFSAARCSATMTHPYDDDVILMENC